MLTITGSNADPLLSDDLAIMLAQFPNDVLRALLNGLGKHTPVFGHADRRAVEVRALPEGSDLCAHATAIADEVRWWGANSVHLAMGYDLPTWTEVIRLVAEKNGAKLDDEADGTLAWRIDQLLLERLAVRWKAMPDKQRAEAVAKPGLNAHAAGGVAAVAGGGAMAFAEGVAALVAGRAAPDALAAAPAVAVLAPVVAAAATAWTVYNLAGASHRALGPAVALIAQTRQTLRDQRMAAAFRED